MSDRQPANGYPPNGRLAEERRTATQARLDRLDAATARVERAIAGGFAPAPADVDVLRGATPEERAIYARVMAALTAPLEPPADA